MPLPILLIPLVPWLVNTAGLLASGGVATIAYSEIKRKFNDVGPESIRAALEKMGLTVDADHPLTDEGMTMLINKNFLDGSEIQLESIFDREKMRNGFKKLALKKAAEKLGFAGVTTEAGLKTELQAWLSEEVMKQMAEEAGEVFEAAKESYRVSKIVSESEEKPGQGWNAPSDFSEAGISNRERQARYRQTHKKTWVERGAA